MSFLKRRIRSLVGKLKNKYFCWFPAAILMSLKGTPTWRLHTKLYKFGYLAYEILHRPDFWQGFLFIYLLSFPRFWDLDLKV